MHRGASDMEFRGWTCKMSEIIVKIRLCIQVVTIIAVFAVRYPVE